MWYDCGMRVDYRYLERLARGVSNHRRIQILDLLHREGELDLKTITHRVAVSVKTAGEHTRKLGLSGHIEKRNLGNRVMHRITDRGLLFLQFLLSHHPPQTTRQK